MHISIILTLAGLSLDVHIRLKLQTKIKIVVKKRNKKGEKKKEISLNRGSGFLLGSQLKNYSFIGCLSFCFA